MKLNPQERHERAEDWLKVLDSFGESHDSATYKTWQRENAQAVADFYARDYPKLNLTVEELALRVKTMWR